MCNTCIHPAQAPQSVLYSTHTMLAILPLPQDSFDIAEPLQPGTGQPQGGQVLLHSCKHWPSIHGASEQNCCYSPLVLSASSNHQLTPGFTALTSCTSHLLFARIHKSSAKQITQSFHIPSLNVHIQSVQPHHPLSCTVL